MWTIAAPRFQQRTASAAISSSVIGRCGFCALVPGLPVVATETISRSNAECGMRSAELGTGRCSLPVGCPSCSFLIPHSVLRTPHSSGSPRAGEVDGPVAVVEVADHGAGALAGGVNEAAVPERD